MSQSKENPFPFQTTSSLYAVGTKGGGGTAIIREGGRQAKVVLSPALFNLLATLIHAAQRGSQSAAWVPTGFLTVEDLRREITRQAGGTMALPLADSEHVIKAVYRLRKQIGESLFPKGGGERYAKQLLEKTSLGYRLSTAGENLHLVIFGAESSQPDGFGKPDDAQAGTE